MEKKLFKSLVALITYAVLLVAFIVRLDNVLAFLGSLLDAFRPLILGFVLAFILNRPCAFFMRVYEKRLPEKLRSTARPLAVLTAYLAFILLLVVLLSLVIPELIASIQAFIGNLGVYAGNLQALYDWVVEKLSLEALADLNLTSAISDATGKLLTGVLDALTNTVPHLISVTSVVVSWLVVVVTAVVFSTYMLCGAPRLKAQCRRLVTAYLPEKVSAPLLSVTELTAATFDKFVSGQLIEACILGALCFLGMCLFRFSYAPLISVVVGVSALIPVVGAYFGAIVAVVLLVMIDPLQALLFLVFLIVLQQLEGNLIYPRVVGSSLGLPGIWVLAAITVGSALMGFVGLVASVPLASVLYTLLKRDLSRRAGAAPPGPDGSEDG